MIRRTFKVDPLHMISWIERHCYVQNGSGPGIVPAILNNCQLDALSYSKAIRLERDWTITVKPRQVGSSTGWLLAMAYLVKHFPGINILWVSQDDNGAKAIRRKWEIIINALYDDATAEFPDKRKNNEQEYVFKNGSCVVWSYSGSTEAVANKVGRGDTFHLAVFTEVAYWEYPEVTMNSLIPALERSGVSIVMDSTSNGMEGQGEVFFKFAMAASNRAPYHTLLFWPWWMEPSYRVHLEGEERNEVMKTLTMEEKGLIEREGLDADQIQFRRLKIFTHGKRFFEIYPETVEQSFLSGESNVFDPELIARIQAELRLNPPKRLEKQDILPLLDGTYRPEFDLMLQSEDSREGWVRLWKHPIHHQGRNVIGVDAAQGVKDGDWQVACVMGEEAEILAMARLKTTTLRFADVVQQLAALYQAEVLIEDEGNGREVYQLMALGHTPETCERHGLSEFMEHGWGRWLGSGLSPINSKTRPIVVGLFIEFLSGLTEIPDEVILGEMRTLELKNGKVQAAKGFFDDALFATGTALLGRRWILQATRPMRQRARALTDGDFHGPSRYEQYLGKTGKANASKVASRKRRNEGRSGRKRQVPLEGIRSRAKLTGSSRPAYWSDWFS